MNLINKKIIRDAIYIIIIAAFLGMLINIFHPKGYSIVTKTYQKSKKIIFINLDEAKIKFDSCKSLFIDSRSDGEFKDIHIKGAINIPSYPFEAAEKKIKNNFELLKSNVELVLYCSGSHCGSSFDLAVKIIEAGYKRNIYIIDEGIPGWINTGYPTER